MPYQAEISRVNPSCFLFMIDQSRSMNETISSGQVLTDKASGVADIINRWLQELSLLCAKEDGVRDFYQVGVIGYGTSVKPALSGPLAGRDLVPISEIANNPARLEDRMKRLSDGSGGIVEQPVKFPVWYDPVSIGGTPMCKASREAYRILERFLREHPACFPPIIIHITDGESTDGDPTELLRALTSLRSSDGNVLLFNVHLSSMADSPPVRFPDSAGGLRDDYAEMLFQTASPLIPSMRALAREHGYQVSEHSRGFVLNADMVDLIQAIDIGTRPGNRNLPVLRGR
jgi:hypothetical protein